MPINEPSSNIPLADVLRAANGLAAAGLIEDWALGGALAAIHYVEPFTTYDAAIFFIPADKGLTAASRQCMRACNHKAGSWSANISFPDSRCNFSPPAG